MTYFMADLHGEYDLFCRLLEKIVFSANDRLFVCGDVLDKGRHCIQLLKTLFSMPNVICIQGNHEYDFLKYYRAVKRDAPDEPERVLQEMQNYFRGDGYLLDQALLERLETLPFYVEEEKFICVHAGAPLDENGRILPLEDGIPERFVYDRRFKEMDVKVNDPKCVFFGHTPTSYLYREPKILAYYREGANRNEARIENYYKIQLDTGAWLNGVLGCFCLETCLCAYVKKEGKSN